MNLRNCPECGHLFEFTVRNLCPDCINKEDDDFELIKSYLKHNPDAGILEVSEKTGVSEKKIMAFLKNGRLILESTNVITLNCERCGRLIRTGRYCDDCCTSINKVLENTTGTTSNNRGRNEEKQSRFTGHFQK